MTMNMRVFHYCSSGNAIGCVYTRERGTEQSGGSTNHGRRERAEDPCCGQRVERRPNRRDGGGCPWHDHDHGRQVQERGIRNHEYRHQRGLHPDDGGWRHLLRGRFPRVYFCRLRALRIGRKRLHPAWYRREDYGKYKQPAHDHGTGEGGLHPCHGSQGR